MIIEEQYETEMAVLLPGLAERDTDMASHVIKRFPSPKIYAKVAKGQKNQALISQIETWNQSPAQMPAFTFPLWKPRSQNRPNYANYANFQPNAAQIYKYLNLKKIHQNQTEGKLIQIKMSRI